MQIGHLNHLNYPKSSNPLLAATADDDSNATPTEGSAKPGPGATVRPLTPAQDAPGVVLKLQSDGAGPPGLALAQGLVYSNTRRTLPGSDAQADVDGDAARRAEQHSQALQRLAGNSTTLTLDKEGVLVAGAAAAEGKPGDTKASDFVSFAVSAMRTYADEQERLKAQAKGGAGAAATSLIPRSMAEVQKLAARFNLFA